MSSTLRFTGPRQQARPELVALLKEFPQVFFLERAEDEYQVTADATALTLLAAKPGWQVAV